MPKLLKPAVPEQNGLSHSFRGNIKRMGDHWGLLEIFILVQFLSPAILMLPGMQVLRMPVRILPYAASVAMFILLFQRRDSRNNLIIKAPGSGWLVLVFGLLCLSLFHPNTILKSGIAQLGFQLTILCPIIWTMFARVTVRRLQRILWLCLLCNALSALVGALQVLWPTFFLPAEFNLNFSDSYLGSLAYEGTDGRTIVRPPGLTDIPGGAAGGAVYASFLALFFATESKQSRFLRYILLLITLLSFFTLYLTQVRSKFLIVVGSAAVLAFLRIRNGEGTKSLGGLFLFFTAVAMSFFLAVKVGGNQVSTRYLDLAETGLLESYLKNRGHFLDYTFNHVFWEYPFGSGLGRWGMMNSYFGSGTHVPSLWAEIQLTGWLYDGGILMLVLYGTALVSCLVTMYRLSMWNEDRDFMSLARGICCLNIITIVSILSGPSFNGQNGMMFWCLYGLLVSTTNTIVAKKESA